MNRVLSYLTARVQPDRGDAELLAAFAGRHDADAFALLVRRHGPMVHGVCRRWLREPADVDDAFQATFLVLVRRAASIDRPQQLANWLHGVARHVARRQRQRYQREVLHPRLDVAVERSDPDFDLGPLLDEEIGRLPEHYRSAIVLCHLQGLSRREAAEQLGCPEGTLSAWLARALLRLRRRLIRRGVAPAAATVAALTPAAADAVPPELVRATVAAVCTSSLPASVVALSRGVLRMMAVKKIFAASMLTGFLLAFAAGTALLGRALVSGPVALAQAPNVVPVAVTPLTLHVEIRAADDGKRIRELVIIEGNDLLTANSAASLARYLKRVKLDKGAPQRVIVTAPPTLAFAQVQEVLDACRTAGFSDIHVKAAKGESAATVVDRMLVERFRWKEPPTEPEKRPGAPFVPANPGSNAPKQGVQGKVLQVNGNLASVSLGGEDEVKLGTVLQVYRLSPEAKYLGTLKVNLVSGAHLSIGQFTPASRDAAIQKGDTVDTKVLGGDPQTPTAIPLKEGTATEVARVIQELFNGPKADGQRIRVTHDERTNTLFVQGSPADLETIQKLIRTLDRRPAGDITDPFKSDPLSPMSDGPPPKIDGVWKGETGEWVVVGDRLVIHNRSGTHTARIELGKRGGYNRIDIRLDASFSHNGVYAVNGDRLTIYFLERVEPNGDKHKEQATLTFDRQKAPDKNSNPFAVPEKPQ
ncbi:MAG: sigma-70 family RNA polymerase sigma factor [Gemmataceae bacterium]